MTLFDANGDIIQQPDIHDPRDTTPEDAELLARMVAELRVADLEQAMVLQLSPLSAIQLTGLLQLALRHEGTAGDIRATAERFIGGVCEYFANCPAVLEIIDRGFDPAYDQSR